MREHLARVLALTSLIVVVALSALFAVQQQQRQQGGPEPHRPQNGIAHPPDGCNRAKLLSGRNRRARIGGR